MENIKINGEIPSFEYGAYTLKSALVQEARKEGYIFKNLPSKTLKDVDVPKDVSHLNRLNKLMDTVVLPTAFKKFT